MPHFAFFGTRSHYYSLLREQAFRRAISAAGLSCHVYLNGIPDADHGSEAAAGPLEEWVRGLPKPHEWPGKVDNCIVTFHLAVRHGEFLAMLDSDL